MIATKERKFLEAVLGSDGARALMKAVDREPALAGVLIPRAILSWLDFTTEHEYEGPIPSLENSYVQFQKSEEGFNGTISLEEGAYSFEHASVYHLAASIATALELEPSDMDPDVRDQVLVKLGKSIDTLTKAQVLVKELKAPNPLKPTRMTTHGAYHIEHNGGSDRPYSVVHSLTKSEVQSGIASLKDAQPIAQWHQNRYGGQFTPMAKKLLDPAAGITMSHEHHDLGGGDFLTHVRAHNQAGQLVGETLMEHQAGQLKPMGVTVHPDHRRQGIASAMYQHAEKVTAKKVMPSTAQTPLGQALWAGNKQQQQFGKVELPGRTHAPTAQVGPQAPTPPTKQPANSTTKKPKLPNLAVGKSEASRACTMCGGHQFEHNRFRGCICFEELAKSITTTAYGDGYVLTFRAGIDTESVRALMKTFRGTND